MIHLLNIGRCNICLQECKRLGYMEFPWCYATLAALALALDSKMAMCSTCFPSRDFYGNLCWSIHGVARKTVGRIAAGKDNWTINAVTYQGISQETRSTRLPRAALKHVFWQDLAVWMRTNNIRSQAINWNHCKPEDSSLAIFRTGRRRPNVWQTSIQQFYGCSNSSKKPGYLKNHQWDWNMYQSFPVNAEMKHRFQKFTQISRNFAYSIYCLLVASFVMNETMARTNQNG